MNGQDPSLDKRIIVIPYDLLQRLAVKSPSRYFIVDAMGNNVYFKTNKKETAQQLCDDTYGKEKYKIRTEGLAKATKELTAK